MLMCLLYRLLGLPIRTEVLRWAVAFMHSDPVGDYWSLIHPPSNLYHSKRRGTEFLEAWGVIRVKYRLVSLPVL